MSNFNERNFIQKYLALLFFALFSLLFSSVSVANTVLDELQAAIDKKDKQRVEWISNFRFFFPLPTVQESKSFLERKSELFGPSEFLGMLLRSGYSEWIDKKRTYIFSDELFKLMNDLVRLVCEYKPNFQKATSFQELPSVESSMLLLENGFNPSIFLQLISKVHCDLGWNYERRCYEEYDELTRYWNGLYALTELALVKYKADHRMIIKFGTLPSLKLGKLLLDKGLPPSKFYYLVSTCGTYNYGKQIFDFNDCEGKPDVKLTMQRDDLLGLALSMGANPDEAAKFSKEEESVEFNPEETDFSKMETIKTWVASKYHQDAKMMEKNTVLYSNFI